MAKHILKCTEDYFDAVRTGHKTFEVRLNDRGFQRGDLLYLRRIEHGEYRPCMDPDCGHSFCGPDKWLIREITYVYSGDRTLRDDGGLVPGWVVLGLGEL